jgi:hypothetical protein
MADLVDLLLDRKFVETGQRQAQKKANPAVEDLRPPY